MKEDVVRELDEGMNLKTLTELLDDNNLFTLEGRFPVNTSPEQMLEIRHRDVTHMGYAKDLAISYDARALSFLDTFGLLLRKHGVCLSKWEVSVFSHLIKAKPDIGVTLFKRDGEYQGILHLGIIPVDIPPDPEEFKYTPRMINNRYVKANNCHNLLSMVCAAYAESLLLRINKIDVVLNKAKETRQILQSFLMDFSYGKQPWELSKMVDKQMSESLSGSD
jgi:hypothetical protein